MLTLADFKGAVTSTLKEIKHEFSANTLLKYILMIHGYTRRRGMDWRMY
jgi:hypothetical protein